MVESIRYYRGDLEDLEALTRDEVEERTIPSSLFTDTVEEQMNRDLGTVDVNGQSFGVGTALRLLDPAQFEEFKALNYERVDLDAYPPAGPSEDDWWED